MEANAPESTQWEVHCAQGRIVLEGWIPQRLYAEGVFSTEQAELIDALLDTVPTQPVADAGEQVRAWAASRLSSDMSAPERTSSSFVSRLPYRRTLSLVDRQAWCEAMAPARFLDFCRMTQDPN